MIEAITGAVGSAITIAGNVVTALFGTAGSFAAVQPIIYLIIGVGLVGWGVKLVKSLVWGF